MAVARWLRVKEEGKGERMVEGRERDPVGICVSASGKSGKRRKREKKTLLLPRFYCLSPLSVQDLTRFHLFQRPLRRPNRTGFRQVCGCLDSSDTEKPAKKHPLTPPSTDSLSFFRFTICSPPHPLPRIKINAEHRIHRATAFPPERIEPAFRVTASSILFVSTKEYS